MPDSKQKIIGILQSGGIVALPTDTVYGLAVDPTNPQALKKLYTLKGRAEQKPLVYMVADQTQLKELVAEIPACVKPLLKKYWPGPLTVIFKNHAGSGTLGIRIPNNVFLLELLKDWGRALAVTSANLSGEPEINDWRELQAKFDDKIEFYLPATEPFSGQPSTIIDVSSGRIKVVRAGAIQI